jgi:hypothetical protein
MSTVVQQSILNKGRQDKFLLVLNLPSILKSVNKTDAGSRATDVLNLDSLQYSIHGTIVPETTIPEIELPFGGQTAKTTSYTKNSYKAVTVSFTVDNQFNNWWVLWYWLNVINNNATGTYNADGLAPSDNFYGVENYQTRVTVYGLDEYNNKVIQWDYLNAFITTLGDLTYSYRESGQIESSFTFAFGQLNTQLLDPNT